MERNGLPSGPILITGAAGFIGYHVAERLLSDGYAVVGVDNLNDYYDVRLKSARLDRLKANAGFEFHHIDLADQRAVETLFSTHRFRYVIHLAAQAGVRYSIENPHVYVQSNLVGFLNVLEGCRQAESAHLVYASSSSVYGANRKVPFETSDPVDHPVSLYAATKKSNELMAHAYAHLYDLPVTGLRFFTVYGPWGRPDMAYYLFTKAIYEGTPIRVFNEGQMRRDFTYIDDIVEGIVRVFTQPPSRDPAWNSLAPDPAASAAPYRLFNIGSQRPIALLDFIQTLEDVIGRSAEKVLYPMQPGDVLETYADVEPLSDAIDFRPKTTLRAGLERFATWYAAYHDLPAPAFHAVAHPG